MPHQWGEDAQRRPLRHADRHVMEDGSAGTLTTVYSDGAGRVEHDEKLGGLTVIANGRSHLVLLAGASYAEHGHGKHRLHLIRLWLRASLLCHTPQTFQRWEALHDRTCIAGFLKPPVLWRLNFLLTRAENSSTLPLHLFPLQPFV